MEQHHPRPIAKLVRRSLSPLLVAAALTGTAMVGGCAPPRQRAVIAVPAARSQGEGRPVRLLPPFQLATSQDAVVRIVSDVTCTGTLIADDRVLTAHHCVAARDAEGRILDHDKKPEEIGIELGGDDLPWGEVAVRAIVAPDCGYRAGDGDIAILVLSRHLIGISTVSTRLEAAPERNDSMSVVGFGRCALSRGPIHRIARDAKTIESVAPGHFAGLASICPGDSGGPVFSSKGDLIGVTSASVMDGDDHTLGTSIFTRVDVWPQLFSAALEISNGASPSELPPFDECRLPAAATRRSPTPSR